MAKVKDNPKISLSSTCIVCEKYTKKLCEGFIVLLGKEITFCKLAQPVEEIKHEKKKAIKPPKATSG